MLARGVPGRRPFLTLSALGAAVIAGASCAAAAEPARLNSGPVQLAQTAVGAAFGAPVQPKVEAPAASATVKAGGGGAPAALDSPSAAPRTPTITTNAPDYVTAGLTAVMNTPLPAYIRQAGWPAAAQRVTPVASGVNHGIFRLTTQDGRVITLEQTIPPAFREDTPIYYPLPRENGEPSPGTMISYVHIDGNSLVVQAAYSLTTGELITPPPVRLPLNGGTASVPAAGGSLSITIDGAHALTTADQTEIARIQGILDAQQARVQAARRD